MNKLQKEYMLIWIVNILYIIITSAFLGGGASIDFFHLEGFLWLALPMWIIYTFFQFLALKISDEGIKKYIVKAVIFTICLILIKIIADFIWGATSWEGQTYRQIAIIEGILPYIYEILLILAAFFALGKKKISWCWKQIRVPGTLLIVSIISYVVFLLNNQFQFSEAAARYSGMFQQEQIDLYFAILIMRGNPWFYAAFAIILWWCMRRLTNPAQTTEKIKNNNTFSFNSKKAENGKELTVLLSTSNDTEAEIIRDLLKENGIFTVIRDRESGDAMRLYMGNSIFEKEILVNRGEYDRAKKLVEDTYTGTEEEISEYEELAEQREIKRRTFIVLVLALIVIFVLLALIIK